MTVRAISRVFQVSGLGKSRQSSNRYFAVLIVAAILVASAHQRVQAAEFAHFDMTMPVGSSGMDPTIAKGDLVAVRRFSVGELPKRGDVLVFHAPGQSGSLFLKRVVGLPGDEVSYLDKHLRINGHRVEETPEGTVTNAKGEVNERFRENLDGVSYDVLVYPSAPSYVIGGPDPFPNRQACNYNADGVSCKVPPGDYWVLGDNLDFSLDSRYFGFVPAASIVGKVVAVMRPGE